MADQRNERQKCAHEACKCMVPSDQKFCSDYCAAPDDAETTSLQGKDGCKCVERPVVWAMAEDPPRHVKLVARAG